MEDAKLAGQVSNFKDRKKGLIIFGFIRILFGGMGVFTVFLVIMNKIVATNSEDSSISEMLMAILFCILQSCMVLWYIITGIGSIKILRWSRVLILYSSWTELVITVCEYIILVLISFASGMVLKFTIMPSLPTTIIGAFVNVFFILFYSSKDVKGTYEIKDQNHHWVDRYPLFAPFVIFLYGLCVILLELINMYLQL